MAQNKSSAVMAQRIEPPDSLDDFPTPPWATRALCEMLDIWDKDMSLSGRSALEPACGRGDMVRPLREYFGTVRASDIFDYGYGLVEDFLFPGRVCNEFDWIITNPPFRLAEQFALMAMEEARAGVALLVRSQFLEGIGRYKRLFLPHCPRVILQFTERVPIFKGRLDAKGSTASSYCWVIWHPAHKGSSPTDFLWIPPCRKHLEHPGDYEGYS